jgi:DHA1 family inner membrane transport protein
VSATTAPAVLPDRVLVRELWPVLAAAALGLVPFTVFGTYLVAIAAAGPWDVSVVGSLRGLGGIAALVVGVVLAPALDRVPRAYAAAAGLLVLAVAALLGTAPALVAVAGFCLLVGTATSILNPALSALAADRYADPATAGRAATLVGATTSMTAMLAAPVVAVPAMFWGWRAPLIGVAAAAVLCALALCRVQEHGDSGGRPVPGTGYLRSLGAVLSRRPTTVPLFVSLLRTTAFMGWLAYVAAFYDERFGLSPGTFTLVWTLSGGAFFLGNLIAGRILARLDRLRRIGGVALGGCVVGVAAQLLLVEATALPVALTGSVLLAAGHAAVAAAVTTLLVRGTHALRGTALGLNGAAQSLGVFAGAALAGLALAVGEGRLVGVVLAGTTALAAVGAAGVCRREPAGDRRGP